MKMAVECLRMLAFLIALALFLNTMLQMGR